MVDISKIKTDKDNVEKPISDFSLFDILVRLIVAILVGK
jgi:hypothetical protein